MYFLDSTEDKKHEYNQNDFARFHNQIIGTGVSDVDSLTVSAKNNMEIALSAGWIFANGFSLEIKNTKTLEHDVAHPDNDRIDRVVIRFDTNPERLDFYPVIKKGTPAKDPVAPELTRDNYVHEMSIAQVLIKAGKSYIEDSEITDERENDEVCGYIDLHNIYRGLFVNEYGMVTMPNQSYIQMDDVSPLYLEGNDGPPYTYTDVVLKPDIDRQEEVKDGYFYPKADGAYMFTLHTRIPTRLGEDGLPKLEGRLFVNGDEESESESFFNEYGPLTQAKGTVIIHLEEGDKVSIKLGVLRSDEIKSEYRRVTISKIN